MDKGKPVRPSLAGLMICALANAPALPLFAEEISASPPVEVRVISTEFKYVPANSGSKLGAR